VSPVSNSAPETEPSGAAELVCSVWNSHDAHALGAVFPADGEFTDVLGHHAVGPEAIGRLHVIPFARLFAAAELTLPAVRVRRLTPEIWRRCTRTGPWRGTPYRRAIPLPLRQGARHIVVVVRDGRRLPLDAHNSDYGAAYAPIRDLESLGTPEVSTDRLR
jgi:hypothetical protein